MTVAIVADSTCDLSNELAAERQIGIVPLYVLFGPESLKDRLELSVDEFYQRLKTTHNFPTTSQPNPADFLQAFAYARDTLNATSIVCTTISSKLSATYSSALQAGEQAGIPVSVIDSKSASRVAGFMALTAANARDAGKTHEEIVELVKKTRDNSHIHFSVASLIYLQRGGRIGEARRFLGDLLKIRPILGVREGEVAVTTSVRTRNKVLKQLIVTMAENVGDASIKRLAILHAHAMDRGKLADMVRDRFELDGDIDEALISPVLGVHLGPGAIGMAYELE